MENVEIFKIINKERLENKNNWYFLNLEIDNLQIKIKGYNTWLQIFQINGVSCSNVMDQSVKDFKNHILKSLEKYHKE